MSPITAPSLAREKRLVLAAVTCTLLAVGVWVAVAIPHSARAVQIADDFWHDAMAGAERPPLVVAAKVLAVTGGAWVTAPFNVLLLLLLWRRRAWARLWGWALAVYPAQITTWIGKAFYARPRPGDALVDLSSSSFPSGHSMNAAAMSLALVLLFVPPGARSKRWLVVAIGYMLIMALSRNYLRVHWASDVTAGVLSGACIALWSVLLVPRFTTGKQRAVESTLQ